MQSKRIDEGPAACLLTRGGPLKVTRSSPFSVRRWAWFVRRRPGAARKMGVYLIWPDGRSNIHR